MEEVKQFIQSGEYNIRFDNSQHLNLIGEDQVNGFHNLLLAKKWRVILSEEPYRFITSDNPVADWNSASNRNLWRNLHGSGAPSRPHARHPH